MLAKGLETWVRHTVGPEAVVVDFAAPQSGMANETVVFGLRHPRGDTARYVVRLAPSPASRYPTFPIYDLPLQRRCMELVAASSDVPVPRTPWVESDPSWLGSPFLVMTHVDGVVPSDNPPYVFTGWLLEASSEDRARLQAASVGVLARLHEITPERHDLSFLALPGRGRTPLDQQLGYQRWFYDWAREGASYPLIERAFAWVESKRPVEGPPVLNWGDSRIGNVLYRDFEPVAVLDWEMAAVGPAEVDIGWMIFMHRFFQHLTDGYGLPGLPDFLQRADVAATYERLSGRRVRDLEWFEVYAALRFAIHCIRTGQRSIAYGEAERPEDPDDVIFCRPLLERMLAGGREE